MDSINNLNNYLVCSEIDHEIEFVKNVVASVAFISVSIFAGIKAKEVANVLDKHLFSLIPKSCGTKEIIQKIASNNGIFVGTAAVTFVALELGVGPCAYDFYPIFVQAMYAGTVLGTLLESLSLYGLNVDGYICMSILLASVGSFFTLSDVRNFTTVKVLFSTMSFFMAALLNFVISEAKFDPLKITVDRNDISKNPGKYLYELEKEDFSPKEVEFLHEPALDRSGPTREFIRLLVDGILAKDILSYLDEEAGPYKDRKELYRAFGRLFRYMSTDKPVTLGNLPQREIFQLLDSFTPVDFVTARKSEDKMVLAVTKRLLNDPFKRQIFDYMQGKRSFTEVEELAESIGEGDESLDDALQRVYNQELSRGEAMLALADGFHNFSRVSFLYEMIEKLQKNRKPLSKVVETSKTLSSISSSLSREDLIRKMQASDGFLHLDGEKHQLAEGILKTVKDWIQKEATDEQIEAFITYCTGSGGLGEKDKITLAVIFEPNLPVLDVRAITCFNRVEICLPVDQNSTKEVIPELLKAIQTTSFTVK